MAFSSPCLALNKTLSSSIIYTSYPLTNFVDSIIINTFKDYREHKEGFYVYAKPNKCDPQTVVKYISRYSDVP